MDLAQLNSFPSSNLIESGPLSLAHYPQWQSFAEAARAALPHLGPADRRRVEDVVFRELSSAAWVYSQMHDLEDLLKCEYASSEPDPALRKRLLDLLDEMLALDIGGAQVLQAHERD